MLLLTYLIIVFSGVVAGAVVGKVLRKQSPWLLAALPLSAFIFLLQQMPAVLAGVPVKESYQWVNGLDFNLQFHLDGLSMLFALLITGIGTLIVIYGGNYLSYDKHLSRFYAFLFLFMGAMLGVVLSDNIFALFVFWELTSLSSYLLIGYKHGYADSRKSALQALLVTGTGGLALMAGLLLASMATETPVISEWKAGSDALVNSKHFGLMLALILLGAFTKSAQFPFHFWLPNAMAAPTPVSAYLHSATMVKAGVYLLARLNPYFSLADEWHLLLMFFGGITMVMGAVWALFQSDLKKILAYTTISALGVLVFSIGIGTPAAVQGALVFLLAHAFYKGGLFMLAGNIDRGTGTRDVNVLSGLFGKMPATGTAAVLTALSMAGFPLLLGFIAKELLYEATLHAPQFALMLTAAFFITGVIFTALAFLLGWKLFFSKEKSVNHAEQAVEPQEVSAGMFVGPLILGAGSLVAGIMPEAVQTFLGKAAAGVSAGATGLKLSLWHGFTPVLGLSALTLFAGWALYRKSAVFRKDSFVLRQAEKFGPENWYDLSWKALIWFAARLTGLVQSGYLRVYITTILFTFITLSLLCIFYYKLFDFNFSFTGVDAYEILLALLVAASIVFTVRATSRLAAIAILGVAGYGIAVFYAVYGAADLAMTQFLIETLTVVVFVYVLYKLPGYIKKSSDSQRVRDALIAFTGGAVMTAIILLVTNYPLSSELKNFFAANSYVLAKGRNVVNVILVDFRALDTMGEITVLGIAAVGVFALSRLRLSKQMEH